MYKILKDIRRDGSEAITESSFFLIKFTSHSCCHLLPNTHLLRQPYAVIGSFSEMANRILNHSMTFFPYKSETKLFETLQSNVCGYQGFAQAEPRCLLVPNFCPRVTRKSQFFFIEIIIAGHAGCRQFRALCSLQFNNNYNNNNNYLRV